MAASLIRGKGRRKFIVLCSVIVSLLLIASGIVTLTNLAKQQDRESLMLLKDEQLKTLVDARSKLQPAANTYLAAYKEAQNAGGSREKVEQDSKNEHDAFKEAEASARDAMETLKAGRGIKEGQASDAIAQFEDSYLGFVDFMAGLVDSYPQFNALFRDGDESCDGIFIGGRAANLTERNELLTKAASICLGSADKLGQSKNSAYIEYAWKIERRVRQLEVDAAAMAKAERDYETFDSLEDQLVQKADAAKNRNAPSEELLAIADEASSLNKTITANRSAFEFSAKRYTKTVKEMPSLLEDVFSKHVAGEIKHFDSVIPMRVNVLKAVLDDELVE